MNTRLFLRLFLFTALSGTLIFPQTTSITWELSANANVSAVAGNIAGEAQTMSTMQLNSYGNVTGSGPGSSQLTTITGGAWPGEAQQNDYRYVEFRVRPAAGYRFTISSIAMYYGGKGGGNMKGNIAYSTDTTTSTFTRLNAATLAVSSSAGTMQAISYTPTVLVDNGKTFYLRVYPWYTSASTGKYLCLQGLVIQGTTQSLTGTGPTVTTANVTGIGGINATCGGTVTDTGTAAVTARGVCWNTNANPLITGPHTSDGSGAGAFTSQVTNLLPNTQYHIRAYAANSVDVAYGADLTFTTLTVAPFVSTLSASYIGVTSAVAGGNITLSGGADVTARGICWGTAANPTLANSFTNDGGGTGAYQNILSPLNAGTTYHYRAYATNSIGTSYGHDSVFTTLAVPVLPSVTSYNVSAQSLRSLSVSSNVLFDGGAAVTKRGVCWNKTGSPTRDTNFTVDGAGMGIFGSFVQGLEPGTSYFIRAYATNSVGTSYSNQLQVTTLLNSATIVVAKDGSGNFLTVSDAFKAVPNNPAVKTIVYIKRGIYFEKDTLQNCGNVLILGEDRDSTVIRYDDYSGRVVGGVTLGTSTCQTLWVRSSANDITFQNLTIQNISTAAQAVALNIQGDRIMLNNCKLLGFQDTYYTWGTGRAYHKNCVIQGSVDFIFGSGIAVFDNCRINLNRNGGTLTAAATGAGFKHGYVFRNCTITHDSIGFDGNVITNFHLGRPWQNAPQTVFLNCVEPAALNPAGWLPWNVVPALYAEYKCTGPGSSPSGRVNFSRQLTDAEAAAYTLPNIFAKTSGSPAYAGDWYPNDGVLPVEESRVIVPEKYKLETYPNPFNPSTTILFEVPAASRVTLSVHNLLGQRVASLIDEYKDAGTYRQTFSASGLASGVYVCTLTAGTTTMMRKIALLK